MVTWSIRSALFLLIVLSLAGCQVSVPMGSRGVTIVDRNNGISIESTPEVSSIPTVVGSNIISSAHSVRISNVLAKINVIVETRSNLEVSVSGRRDVVKSILIDHQGYDLVIDGGAYECSVGKRIDSLKIHTVIKDSLWVNGIFCPFSETTITLRVPAKTSVQLLGLFGYAAIGDIDADLIIDHVGGENVDAGVVKSLQVDMTGNGNITIMSVDGKVDIDLTGNGDITIRHGAISDLDLNLIGNGDLTVDAEVTGTSNLDLIGNGDIRLLCARGPVHRHSIGNGDIDIRNVCR